MRPNNFSFWKKTCFLFLTSVFSLHTYVKAQPEITQTVRGSVKDQDSKAAIFGAVVALLKDSVAMKVTHTDDEGTFRFDAVPVGRYRLVVRYTSYSSVVLPEVMVNSAKETVLDLQMEEIPMKTEEVVIKASANAKGNSTNEMALVSARTFTVEETDRYAGSRGDPARMASNYAGVRGSDDTQNGVVVRGNSPYSLLWRFENVDIPNPNHFSALGRTNGPVSILNNKYLGTSDFYTGAFPAEFGNSVSSVFDLKMRAGNNEKREYSAQAGILGTELFAEGPLSKGHKSSYIASYRYSTVSAFQQLGIPIGTDAKPTYQDGAFKLFLPSGKNTEISFFGLGGASSLLEKQSEKTRPSEASIYQTAPEDENYKGHMGVLGMNYARTLNEKTYFRLTLAGSEEHSQNTLDLVNRRAEGDIFIYDSIRTTPERRYSNTQRVVTGHAFLNRKIGARHKLKAGMMVDEFFFNFHDSVYLPTSNQWRTRLNYEGNTALIQPYIQWRSNLSERWLLTLGLHGQYLTLNRDAALEPRVGLLYKINENQSLSLGAGQHSQMLPTNIYFRQSLADDGQYHLNNLNTGFLRSRHVAVSYDYAFRKDMRLKLEPYYQYLYKVPVDANPSAYSILNEGFDYYDNYPYHMVNQGTGKNYGIEMTLEKFFSNSWMFLFTGSLYDSRYTASDGHEYNTVFNGLYGVNALAGKEFKWGQRRKSSVGTGIKFTLAGGLRSTPIDTAASRKTGETVFIESQTNTLRLKDYFRTDLKFNYKVNAKKLTHEAGLDLVNIFNTKNVLRRSYAPGRGVVETYQLGFLPIVYYKLEF